MGFVAITTHICKLIALYTANMYSAEREMSASAYTHSVAGCGVLLSSTKRGRVRAVITAAGCCFQQTVQPR